MLTDEVTGSLGLPASYSPPWASVPSPGIQSLSVLIVDSSVVCPSGHNYLEANSKLGQTSRGSYASDVFNANCILFLGLPQPGWLKTKETCYLTVQEAGS